MKAKLLIFLLIIVLLSCAYKISPYKFSCHNVESKMLGTIDFNTDIKNAHIESHQDTITFANNEDELAFRKIESRHPADIEPMRYRAYTICKKIIKDKSPVTKYAYYEYENIVNMFVTEGGQLIIQPQILNGGKDKLESLYINFSIHSIGYLKAFVPFYTIDENKVNDSHLNWCTHHDYIELGNDIKFEDVWVYKQSFQKGELAVYYSKPSGIVALGVNEKIYIRK